jgi:hypothetical protein
VHWAGFSTTTLNRSKAHAITSLASAQGSSEGATESSGVLFVIEPPHAISNLGACLAASDPPLSVQTAYEDEVLLPAGLAFRVVSYEKEDGLRTIKLRHVGRWVSDNIYALKEIAMTDAVARLQQAIKAYKYTVANVGLETGSKSLPGQEKQDEEMQDQDQQAHQKQPDQTETWTPTVDFSSLPCLTSKVLRRAAVAKRLSSHFPSDLVADPDAIKAAKGVEIPEAAGLDHEVETTTLRLTILTTESADAVTAGFSFGAASAEVAHSDNASYGHVGAFMSCRVTRGASRSSLEWALVPSDDDGGSGSGGQSGNRDAELPPSIWVPGPYVRSVPWQYLNITQSLKIENTLTAVERPRATIELLRRRQDEEHYAVYAEATIDFALALANKTSRGAVWDEWYDLYPTGEGAAAVGRVHVEFAWLA